MKLNILIILFILIVGCHEKKNLLISCQLKQIDSLIINEDADKPGFYKRRGGFKINDTLYFDKSHYPIDSMTCKRIKKINNQEKKESFNYHNCRTGAIPPPFTIYRRKNSDTIHVIKNGEVYQFYLDSEKCIDNV